MNDKNALELAAAAFAKRDHEQVEWSRIPEEDKTYYREVAKDVVSAYLDAPKPEAQAAGATFPDFPPPRLRTEDGEGHESGWFDAHQMRWFAREAVNRYIANLSAPASPAAQQASALPRYGFPTGKEPRPVECADGYWTPWHLAQQPAVVGDGLLNALRSYEQADADGTFVKVSRQALDEAIAALTPAATPGSQKGEG